MAYRALTRPYGDLNSLPATQYNGNLETLQGVIRLIDAMMQELYGGAGGSGGGATGALITSSPGAGSVTGYAPGIALTVGRLDIASDAADTQINDLTAGFDGQFLRIRNTGTGTLTLVSENAGSTAANRFTGSGDVNIAPGDKADLIYYGGSVNRWVM